MKEEVELTEAPSPNQAAIDRFMKGGGKITKIEPGTGKQGAKQVAGFKKTFDRAMKKQREIEKDDGGVKRRQGEGLQRDGSEKSVAVEEVTIERFELYGWRKHGYEPVRAVGECDGWS